MLVTGIDLVEAYGSPTASKVVLSSPAIPTWSGWRLLFTVPLLPSQRAKG